MSQKTPRFKWPFGKGRKSDSEQSRSESVSVSELHQTRQSWWKRLFSKDKANEVGLSATPSVGKSKPSSGIQIESLPGKIFHPDSRQTIHRTFAYGMILSTSFIGARLTALYLTPSEVGRPQVKTTRLTPPRPPVADIRNFARNDLFQTKSNEQKSKTDQRLRAQLLAKKKCEDADLKSRLPIKLINTVVLQHRIKSVASVQIRSGRKLREVREGDNIERLAKIGRIGRYEMVVKNLQTGACELIASIAAKKLAITPIKVLNPKQSRAFKAKQKNKKMDGIVNDGNNFKVSRKLLNDKLKDIGAILRQARAIPIKNPDGTMAFRIVEIVPGSVYSYLGVQNEDVITAINGKPIKNANEIMGLFSKMSNLAALQLTVERNGAQSVLDYEVSK